MHIVLESDLFLDRVDKLLSLWRDMKGRMLRISTNQYGRAFFQCEPKSLDLPARIIEQGEVMVDAVNAKKALQMYSLIDNLEIFTQGEVLVIKQRNYTMTLPCIMDEELVINPDVLTGDRLVMLKVEKRRLQAQIRRIDEEINSMRGNSRVYRRR